MFDEPIYYVVNAYMVFFGAVTMITESDPSFITQLHDTLFPVQKWMYEWAKGLTMLWGRGLFYVFQGKQLETNCCPLVLYKCIFICIYVYNYMQLNIHKPACFFFFGTQYARMWLILA